MIAYYKLVSNMFGGEQRQLTAVADLVIDDQGTLLKDRQGYVNKAVNTAKAVASVRPPIMPDIGSKWQDEDDYVFIYVGAGTYCRTGQDVTLRRWHDLTGLRPFNA